MSDKDIKINAPKLEEGKGEDSLKKAVEAHTMHRETFEEAWQRILSMKNSDNVQKNLLTVMEAMKTGEIVRATDRVNKKFSKAEALDYYAQIQAKEIEEELKQMVVDIPDNYHLITSKAQLKRVVEILEKEKEIVFDVETTGVDIRKDFIVGNVLSATEKDLHFYIPTKHKTSDKQLDHDYVMEMIKPIYENPSIAKIAHNASFDIHMLMNEGIEVCGDLWDTQEVMKLLNENEPTFALKPLVEHYLKIPSKTYGQLFGNKGFDEVDLATALAYASKDGEVTYLLKEFQRGHLEKLPSLYKYVMDVEMPLIKNVVKMERVGFNLDIEYATKYAEELKTQIDKLYEKVSTILTDEYNKDTGEDLVEINLNSPAQLKVAIESYIGREIENTNAKDTLKPLSEEFGLIKELLEYRKLQKLHSTYIGNLPSMVDDKGKIYTQFNPNGAVTGRFSSGGGGTFNVQNIPEEARKMFIAPEGYYIVGADFSAQEVRIIASESQEGVLLDAFDNGLDPYAVLASRFFEKPYEDCYKNEDGSDTHERKMMKVVLLSSMYGATKWGLAKSLDITPDEAEEFRVNFFRTYPKIDQFIKRTRRFVETTGFVWIGEEERKRRLPVARNRNPMKERERGRALRQAPNARIQGLAAIQTKRTLNRLADECEQRGWILYFTIHDEIAVLMPEGFTREDVDKFGEIMTQTYLLNGVKNEADVEIQKTWSEAVKAEAFFEKGLSA